MKRHIRKIRGATLLEVMTAAFIGTMVLMTSITIFIAGMASWYRGEGRMVAENTSMVAVRRMSAMLKESMTVQVDANGLGISYRLPTKDGAGTFVTPAIWDNVTRRIYVQNGTLYANDGTNTSVLAKGVILTDPQSAGGATAYRVFVPGAGTNVRQVTLMLVVQTTSYRTESVKSRARETIFLRNIPEITR
jgi:hypothetical protein